MTIPIESVTSRRLNDNSFCCRITLNHRMACFAFLGSKNPCIHYI